MDKSDVAEDAGTQEDLSKVRKVEKLESYREMKERLVKELKKMPIGIPLMWTNLLT